MDVDQAMKMVAQAILAAGGLSAERVRRQVVNVVTGGVVPGLSDHDAVCLQEWFRSEFGGSPDPAGALYQAMLSRVVVPVAEGSPHIRRERGAHRSTGAYYTEQAIVRYMLRQARAYLPTLRSAIDPACGSGAFLAGAAQAGIEQLSGFDTDAVALEIARANLPGADLRVADALLDDLPGGYDLCMGNPPYISSGLRGAAAQDEGRQQILKDRYPATAQYKINTYPLFVERGLQLIRDDGVLGYILPDSFLTGRYFEGLRCLLLENTLLELTLISQDFWQHGHVGQSVILFVRRGPSPPGHCVSVKLCRSVGELDEARPTEVAQCQLAWGPLRRFPLMIDPGERALAHAMEEASGGRCLGDLFRSYSGLIAKRGQQSLLRSVNPGNHGPWGRLLRSGREIDRYHLAWAGEEVCLDPALIKSGGQLSHYRNPKIMLRQTADSLRAVYDDQGYFCLNNIHLLIPRTANVPARAALGLINSGPVNRFYRAMTMETGRLYAQVDLDLLEALPVPLLEEETGHSLECLVRMRESAAPNKAARIEARIDGIVEHLYGLR